LKKKLKKILFVVNTPDAFLSHRLPLAIAARDRGFDVHIISGVGNKIDQIKSHGLTYHLLPLSRSGKNPLKEIITLIKLITLFIRIKPDLVHLVTLKPILYGGIAAKISGVKAVVCAVAGLGSTFLVNTAFDHIRRAIIKKGIIWILKSTKPSVIFQNNDDKQMLLSSNSEGLKIYLIPGSGVNLDEYLYVPEPVGKKVISMSSRIIRDKGVLDFADAAAILFDRGYRLEFRLFGDPDPANPRSLVASEIENLKKNGQVKLLGYQKDIAQKFAESNIVCLPSYREGMPKALIEAAACGRAVVTTDVPGCRDAIIKNKTGFLVPVKNAQALADAIEKLVNDDELRKTMGAAGRKLAEERFGIDRVIEKHIQIYDDIIETAQKS
jgi:glycosyltransferase involved in cell wall biosynthesis